MRQIDLHWVRAFTVLMHLGLIERPLVPHNLMSVQESPIPLPKFQMASRLKILMPSGSKKGTQLYYPFFSISPSKRTPSRFPSGAPMERDSCLQGIFTSLLIYLFNISFRVPGKRALPPGPPHGVPLERDAHSWSRLSFIIQSPWYTSPSPDSMLPLDIKGPLWREMPVSGAFLNISSRVPSKGALPRGPPH